MIKEFNKLFSGYEKAYGIYKINGYDENGKKKGFGNTIPSKITTDEWKLHLSGEQGVGIIPLRDDNTCYFGVIDIDEELKHTHEEIVEKLDKLRIPLLVCRSASGRVHLYAFFEKPTDAQIVREKLSEWSAAIKYGDSELFPKQTYRFNDDDKGNWINIPYFGGDDTDRYAYNDKGKLTTKEFIEYANSMKIPEKELRISVNDSDDVGSLFEFGPPCLKQLCKEGGFGEGGRNNGILNAIVYLKKRYPDDWKEYVHEYNSAMCDPKLQMDEVNRIIKSSDRKDYEYKCKEAPIADCCNKSLCRRAKFGVGGTGTGKRGIEIGNITKYEGDPVFWIVEVDSKRIKLTTDQLISHANFSKICMDQLNRIPSSMTPKRWTDYLDERLSNLTPSDIVKVPEDASHKGQFDILVEDFCTLGNKAIDKEGILVGKPFWDEGFVYFKSRALISFLEKNRFRYDSEHEIWQMLREKDADTKQMHIKGLNVRVWYIPAPAEIIEESSKNIKFKEIDGSKEF